MSCKECNGTGVLDPYRDCPSCDGTGGHRFLGFDGSGKEAQVLPCVIQHGSGSSWCNTCGGKWDFGDGFPCPEAVQPVDVNLSFRWFDGLLWFLILVIAYFGKPWIAAGCMTAWALWFALRDGIPDAPPGE